MKSTYILTFALALFTFISSAEAQSKAEKREARKQERLEKKRQREQAIEEGKAVALELANEQAFVLEADALYDRYMNRYNMVSNSFILLDGDRVVLQTAAPGYFGYNGLGGITLNGKLVDYEVTEGKKGKPLRINAQLNTTALGHGTLNMTISGNGNAQATFRDSWGNRITFSGQVNSLDNSVIYEGMSIFG